MQAHNYSTLIQASDLIALMKDPNGVVIFDASFDLTDTQAGDQPC